MTIQDYGLVINNGHASTIQSHQIVLTLQSHDQPHPFIRQTIHTGVKQTFPVYQSWRAQSAFWASLGKQIDRVV